MKHTLALLISICVSISLVGDAFAKPSKRKKESVAPAATTNETTPTTSSNTSSTVTPDNHSTAVDDMKQPGKLGVGLSYGLGSWPLTLKYFVSRQVSLVVDGPFYDGVLSGVGFGLSGTALFEGGSLISTSDGDLSWQAGAGASAALIFLNYESYSYVQNSFSLGIHADIGLSGYFKRYPIEISFDYRPGISIGKRMSTDFRYDPITGRPIVNKSSTSYIWPSLFNFALSARYYF